MFKLSRLIVVAVLAAFALGGLPTAAQAILLTIDQVIFQSGSGQDTSQMTGTLDVTVTGSNQLTFILKNTSGNGAFTDASAPATMLLTGFGVQVGAGIASGTVTVYTGSTALNFDTDIDNKTKGNQPQDTSNISNQWEYANSAIDGYNLSGVLAVSDVVSSVNNGGSTRFAGPPPTNDDGPGYGALSALETQFGTSTPGVRDTIKFVLNFDNTTAFDASTLDAIEAGHVVLAFGSPTAVGSVPEPSSLLLLGSGLIGVAAFGWRKRSKVSGR